MEATPRALQAELSYMTTVKTGASAQRLTLDESLLGETTSPGGQSSGKLRLDMTLPSLDTGTTYLLYCARK